MLLEDFDPERNTLDRRILYEITGISLFADEFKDTDSYEDYESEQSVVINNQLYVSAASGLSLPTGSINTSTSSSVLVQDVDDYGENLIFYAADGATMDPSQGSYRLNRSSYAEEWVNILY